MKWADKWTPRIKVILPLACLIVVGMAVAAMLYCNRATEQVIEMADAELSRKAVDAGDRISSWYDACLDETVTLSTDYGIRSLAGGQEKDNEKASMFLKAVVKASKQYESAALLDLQGLPLALSDSDLEKELDLSGSELFQKAVQGETAVSDAFESGRDHVLNIFQPVHPLEAADASPGQPAGVLVLAVDMKYVGKKFIKPLRMGEEGNSYLAEPSGMVISHSDNKQIFSLNLSEHEFGRELMKQGKGKFTYQTKADDETPAVDMTAQIQAVDGSGWLLVLELPTDKHLGRAGSLALTVYAACAVIAFILFFALWLVIDNKAAFECLASMHKNLIFCEKLALIILLFTMITLSFGQVVARNIFQTGFMWVDEVLRIEVLWVAFLGAGLAAEYNRHIKIDVLSHVMGGGRGSRILDTSAQVFALLVCIALFWASCRYIQSEARFPACNLIEGVPDWVFRLVIPYFFLAMSFRCVINMRRIFKGTFTRTVEP